MSTAQLEAATATAAPETSRRWHSWHLHAGALEPQALESIVTAVVAPVLTSLASREPDRCPARPWFFMRYWQRGPHVRFRVADLDPAQLAEVDSDLRQAWARVGGADQPRLAAEDYQRAVAGIAAAGEGAGALDVAELRPPGIHPDRYEPEVERYGGPGLIRLSEDLFRTSSLVTLRAVALRQGQRRTFADGLESMAAMVSAWPGDPVEMLDTVRASWLAFLEQALPQLAGTVEPVAASRAAAVAHAADAIRALVGGAPSRWTPWVDTLRTASRLWVDQLGERRARGVFVSHLHMTQNRLGVGAGQEAHVSATLLKLLAADPAG